MLPRDLALETLNSLDHNSGFPERYLERAFLKNPVLSERDRAFTMNLVQGVFRWRLRFDWIIKQAARISFGNIEPPILNILRIALYQIFFMDRVPLFAAVNEAVKQTRTAGKGHAIGFVNGILRHICRQKDQISFPDREKDPILYLSVFYSYPTWLVKKWIRELGTDSTERLLAAGNQVPSLVIRANSLKTDRQGLLRHLEEEGVKGVPTLHSPEGIKIEGPKGLITQLNAFKEGLFQVQCEAAQACSHLLCPRPGESILDLCAGLGGKSTHLAELMGGKGSVLALDMNHGRLLRLVHNSHRLGIGCIQPVVADATGHLSSSVRYSFDKVLMDGPCSGLGNISRHPDSKWARHEGDIKRLALLQKCILDEAVPILRKGGTMLYVTCTISREENEEVVSDFLEKNRGMILEDLKDHVPEWCLDFIDDQGFFKTLPHIHGTDGFFAALFTKR